jgi:hypothetical protein
VIHGSISQLQDNEGERAPSGNSIHDGTTFIFLSYYMPLGYSNPTPCPSERGRRRKNGRKPGVEVNAEWPEESLNIDIAEFRII